MGKEEKDEDVKKEKEEEQEKENMKGKTVEKEEKDCRRGGRSRKIRIRRSRRTTKAGA